MDIRYYEELRNIHKQIEELDKGMKTEEKERKHGQLLAALHQICNLANIARKEGLLALEEETEKLEKDTSHDYLRFLITLVVDGTEPELVKSIGLTRYFCSLWTDYKALTGLMYLEGALAIQAGENPRVIEEKMKVFLPNKMYDNYCTEQEKEWEKSEKEAEEHIIERLCQGKKFWNPKDSGYFVIKLTDYTICDLRDRELQRLMREIDNHDLSLAMKGLSGEARRCIFSCMSERLGKMIAEDMEYMGPVRAIDVLEAAQKMMNTLIYLINRGEIIDRYEYLVPFYDMFGVDVEKEQNKNNKLDELKKLVKEYEETNRYMVE